MTYVYESTDVPVIDCRTWPKKGKIPCGLCKACRDQKYSEQVSNRHQYGRFCKGSDNNQCSICSSTKRWLRIIFHLAGRCMKRCPYCSGQGAPYHKEFVVKHMYRYFLGKYGIKSRCVRYVK
jgi:hypothetical protein